MSKRDGASARVDVVVSKAQNLYIVSMLFVCE